MTKPKKADDNALPMRTGELTSEQVNLLLTSLPFEVTFVDENDIIRFYSEKEEHIFKRSPDIIGRTVQDCHPEKSVDAVNRIIKEFKRGSKEVAEFWFQKGDMFIYIRYFPLRDENGKYRGVIEVAQDVMRIRILKGEQRTLSW